MNQEEKIDYIYETLKKQESRYKRNLFIKWIIRIIFIAYIYYFIIYSLPNIIDNFKESLTPDIQKNLSESINNINKEEIINKIKSLINK